MLRSLIDVLLFEMDHNERTCDDCGVSVAVRDRGELRQIRNRKCIVCCIEQSDGSDARDILGVSEDMSQTNREKDLFVCGVTGDCHHIDDMVTKRIPIFENQKNLISRDNVPARVLDDPEVIQWAEEAQKLTSSFRNKWQHSDRLLELQADRPGHEHRHIQNSELEEKTYYGVPKRYRPDPTSQVVLYKSNNSVERIPPRPELLRREYPCCHDWGTLSKHRGKVTAASIIAHQYDDAKSRKNASKLQEDILSKGEFKSGGSVWSMSANILRGYIDALETEPPRTAKRMK